MAHKIILNLKGDFIPIERFARAVSQLQDVLAELDVSISGKERVQWGVNRLRKGSAILEAVPRVTKELEYDRSDDIIISFVKGLKEIQKGAVRPEYFSDEVLDSTKKLVNIKDQDIETISVTGSINGRSPRPVLLTLQVISHIDQVLGPQYHFIGSVEGKLETISIHRIPRVTIYHSRTNKPIRCKFSDQQLDDIKVALGKRVVVSGIVFCNAQGDPIRVNLEHLRILGKEPLPTAEELSGYLDFSNGDITTGELIRSMRGG